MQLSENHSQRNAHLAKFAPCQLPTANILPWHTRVVVFI